MKDLLKKALAECIGTFVLVFVACGVDSRLDDMGDVMWLRSVCSGIHSAKPNTRVCG